jgi:tRNA pseudouridine55 synthase
MYSALKREGRPLYELARAGIEVERAPRRVEIQRLQLVEQVDERVVASTSTCSKGTYVRVLAEDIGSALGCGAHLAALRRTRVGRLTLERSVALAALEAMPLTARRAALLPLDELLDTLPSIELDAVLAQRFRLGQRLAIEAEPRGERIRVYAEHDGLLGTATVNEWGVVGPERLISNEKSS